MPADVDDRPEPCGFEWSNALGNHVCIARGPHGTHGCECDDTTMNMDHPMGEAVSGIPDRWGFGHE
jgi:hypothetical protein